MHYFQYFGGFPNCTPTQENINKVIGLAVLIAVFFCMRAISRAYKRTNVMLYKVLLVVAVPLLFLAAYITFVLLSLIIVGLCSS